MNMDQQGSAPTNTGPQKCRSAAVALTIAAFTLYACLPALAQSRKDLDGLIFDPVMLDADTLTVVPALTVPLQFLPLPIPANGAEDNPNAAAATDMPGQPDSQPSALEITRTIAAYQEAVSELEADEGPFTPALYETLIDLATQYQLGGEHEEAIEVLERAEHISRVNHGLYHPEQFASIERMIDSYIALGEYAKASQKQRYLVYLSEQHYGLLSPSTLPSLVNLAENNMKNFTRVLREDAPVFSFSTNTNLSGRRQPTRKEMAFGNLYVAQQNYMRAIATMIENEQYFDPMLLDLEYSYLETLLLQAFRNAILEDPDYYLSGKSMSTGSLIKRDFYRRTATGYQYGKDSFERILAYLRHNPDARIYQLVNALMEYGDWSMVFGHGQSAHEKYREAYELVERFQLEQETVNALFQPDLPVHLPLITAKPNSREKFGIPEDAELSYTGYIDLAFTVSRFGNAKGFKVLGKAGEVGKKVERRLIRYLRNSPFRPAMNAEEKFVAREFTVRYYFTYADRVI